MERTLDEDVAYGFRMLVDMAERSLSDSPFLDPTTAVQAIDRLHDGLRQLAVRELPDGRCHDSEGQLRLTVPVMDWNAYVHLAFDEIRIAGARSPQISRRLIAAFDDLHQIAPPDRRAALEQQLTLLRDGVSEMTWSNETESSLSCPTFKASAWRPATATQSESNPPPRTDPAPYAESDRHRRR